MKMKQRTPQLQRKVEGKLFQKVTEQKIVEEH